MNYFIICELFAQKTKTLTQSRKDAKDHKEKNFAYSLRLSVFACAFLFWFLLVRLMEATA